KTSPPPTATIRRSAIGQDYFPVPVSPASDQPVRDKIRASVRYVYDFDEPCEGGRDLLGGKGTGLAEMTQLGVPVPDGFTITTEACRAYMAAGDEGLADGLPRGRDRA